MSACSGSSRRRSDVRCSSATQLVRLVPVKTSLGIWAFGAMATRFNPGGYKPELAGISTAQKVRTAVDGLEGLIDDYEFHYPQ
jgi:hypothetical protein